MLSLPPYSPLWGLAKTFLLFRLASVRTAQVVSLGTTTAIGISLLNRLAVFPLRAAAIYLIALFWILGLPDVFFKVSSG